jgi:multiple antibiotic resistance protein
MYFFLKLQRFFCFIFSSFRNDSRNLFYQEDESSCASIVLTALPLIVSARTMTSLLFRFHTLLIVNVILLNILLVYFVLKSSSKNLKTFQKNGLYVIGKAFGVVILAIAVKLFAVNVKGLSVYILFL